MRPSHLETRYRYDLSPRQREVMDLLQRGLTNAEIADRLGVTLDGAKYHVREILGKLGAESREEAVSMWREMPSRARPWERFGLAFVVAGTAAAVAVIVAAVVLAMVARDGSDQAAADPTALPLATATVARPAPTVPALTECTSLDVTLMLETIPRAEDVLVRLSASGTAPCRMLGPLTLWLIRPPVTPGPDYPPEANTNRFMKIALDFPFTGVLGEWSWRNWCAQPMTFLIWQAKGPGGSVQVGLNTDFWPPCLEPDQPTWLERESLTNALGGDATPDPQCLGTAFPEWVCTFATSVAVDAVAGEQQLFPERISNDAFFLCDGTGTGPGLPPDSTICEQADPNTSVRGYWLETAASGGTFVSQDAFEAGVEAALPPAGSASAISCLPANGYSCGYIVIVVGGLSQTHVALIFRLVAGREPGMVGSAILDGPLPPSVDTPFGDFALTILP